MAAESEEIKIVVFDLNGTFYNKSSKDEFYTFLCARKPHKAAYYLQMVYYKILLKMHQIRKTEFKENFFNYLDHLPPKEVTEYATAFWQEEYPKEFNQELKQRFEAHKKNGVQLFCATGGLELYVKPLFDLFKIDGLVGTRVAYEQETYKVQGLACKDDEKLKRIDQHFKGKPYKIIEAYSDSKEPILYKAEKAFLVEDGNISPFKKE